MIKVALVGNIASGKSTVQTYLINKDYVVIDTDMITHDILMDKPDVPEAFEEYDVFDYGKLSKEKLGKLVFSDVKLKEKLEDIVHPLILQEINQAFTTFKDEKIVFISIPLLFEVGWEEIFDKIIFIQSNDDIRLKRLIERNNYTEEYAKLRMNSQRNQEKKLDKSDFVIQNNSTKEELFIQIDKVLSQIQE
jgi:dephospho-CoA kinase